MKILIGIAWLFAALLLWLVSQLSSPYLLNPRGIFFAAVPPMLLAAYFWYRWTAPDRWALLPSIALVAVVIIGISIEENRALRKERVRQADPELVRALGRHIVLGYTTTAALDEHFDRGGVGGVFITGRNVKGRSAEDIAAELARFQERGARPDRPLMISADQEGGPVARLSPPLETLPPLQEKVDAAAMDATDARVREYARVQAAGMRRLGVNVNFAPVVDLKKSYDNLLDFHTKIADRALHESPEVVSRAARIYSAELRAGGVMPTLKHFPGLGRVPADTHHFSAAVDAGTEELESSDWLPFRRVASRTGAMIMLGHVRVSRLDNRYAASQSKAVVRLLREDWGLREALLVTDDMCMNPVVQSPGGIGEAAVRALNAGVDLLLISYHPERYFEVMDALIQAWADGRLDRAALRKSAGRVDAVRAWLAISGPRGERVAAGEGKASERAFDAGAGEGLP